MLMKNRIIILLLVTLTVASLLFGSIQYKKYKDIEEIIQHNKIIADSLVAVSQKYKVLSEEQTKLAELYQSLAIDLESKSKANAVTRDTKNKTFLIEPKKK